MRAVRAAAVLTLTATTILAAHADADEVGPSQTGWWFILQQAPDPIPPVPPLATVPAGGLYVSYASFSAAAPVLVNAPTDGTLAYGAVRYSVPYGSQATLTLSAATGSSALAAQLQACRTAGSWAPADGGQWYAQPGIDRTLCADGSVSADGTQVRFPISAAYTTDGRVDIAIVAGPDATPFSVAFDKPGTKSLSVPGGHPLEQPGANPPSPVPSMGVPSPTAPQPTNNLPTGTPGEQPPDGTGSGEETAGATSPPGPESPATGGFTTTVTNTHPPSTNSKLLIVALLAALTAGWWWSSTPSRVYLFAAAGDRRRRPENRDVFGVGRFARARDKPPDGL